LQEYNTIIGKLLSGINRKKFKRIVDKYKGDYSAKKLHCWEQFTAICLGQITKRVQDDNCLFRMTCPYVFR